ncbi:MAG: hypothetical protein LC792_15730 [Actinobacteria bacterium]|nr:hypothetical protein [Actinomycetota bacterium]
MVSRHNIETLEDLATYLKEGIGNRQRNIREIELRRGRKEADAGDSEWAAELRGEIAAFSKVLQILNDTFNVV